MIKIKRFRQDAIPNKETYWSEDGREDDLAEKKLLKQMNNWISREKPTILDIRFESYEGAGEIGEGHYCWAQIIYREKQ